MQVEGRYPMTVPPTSPFREIVRLLGGGHKGLRLHRVYICDEHGRPVGVVTATDVLRTLVRLETDG